jgi:hypothetical protein
MEEAKWGWVSSRAEDKGGAGTAVAGEAVAAGRDGHQQQPMIRWAGPGLGNQVPRLRWF